MYENGLFPERCPLCNRVNFRNGPDYCEHWWGEEYDGSLVNGPYSEEFEELWALLSNIYEQGERSEAEDLITGLRAARLIDLAQALTQYDKTWWLKDVKYKAYIEPEASMVSGDGWSLYHEDPKWFEQTMAQLRAGAHVARRTPPDC
jgi:hypothetical protein